VSIESGPQAGKRRARAWTDGGRLAHGGDLCGRPRPWHNPGDGQSAARAIPHDEVTVSEKQHPHMNPEELTHVVWKSLAEVPGIVDLHRNPLQALGERVRLDWHGPVRLQTDRRVPLLEVHIVVAAGRPIPPVVDAATAALRKLAADHLEPPPVEVRVFVDDLADEA